MAKLADKVSLIVGIGRATAKLFCAESPPFSSFGSFWK
jgi:hypothetical protein